jgi:hypothetical protein
MCISKIWDKNFLRSLSLPPEVLALSRCYLSLLERLHDPLGRVFSLSLSPSFFRLEALQTAPQFGFISTAFADCEEPMWRLHGDSLTQ